MYILRWLADEGFKRGSCCITKLPGRRTQTWNSRSPGPRLRLEGHICCCGVDTLGFPRSSEAWKASLTHGRWVACRVLDILISSQQKKTSVFPCRCGEPRVKATPRWGPFGSSLSWKTKKRQILFKNSASEEAVGGSPPPSSHWQTVSVQSFANLNVCNNLTRCWALKQNQTPKLHVNEWRFSICKVSK